MISYGRQSITQEDIDAVNKVLRSDFLTQGPMVSRFEELVAAKVNARYASAVNSATSALHISCLALGISTGDIVWTSPNSFVATSNCALYCGAKIDFVDIDPLTYNMSVRRLEDKLKIAELQSKLPKAVIPTHFAGQSCDMESIYALSQKYGFKIIEDASHAIGGLYKNGPVGSCQYSDMTVFSFHPVKIITSGEGGMVLTNNPHLFEKLLQFRSHGITRDKRLMNHKTDDEWYYEQIDLGHNYRMSDIHAALGCKQIERLSIFIKDRHKICDIYHKNLEDLPLILPYQENHAKSALHLYPIQIDNSKTKVTRTEVFRRLRASGIGVNVHYIPIHTQPFYQKMGFKAGDFPEAEKYYSRAISIPIFPSLTQDQQEKVILAIKLSLNS